MAIAKTAMRSGYLGCFSIYGLNGMHGLLRDLESKYFKTFFQEKCRSKFSTS